MSDDAKSPPEAEAVVWFSILERARRDGDRNREYEALRELDRLGYQVTFRAPRRAQ